MGGPQTPWTPGDDRRLSQLHREGISITQAAREMEKPHSTTRAAAARLRLEFKVEDPSVQTIAARDARREHSRRRRTELMDGLADDMARLRDSLFAETEVYNFGGKDNTFETATLPEPSHADKLKLVQAINTAASAIERIQKLDTDAATTDGVAMLDGIAEALKGAANSLRPPEDDEPGEGDDYEDLI